MVSAPLWNSSHRQKIFLSLSLNPLLSVTSFFSCALPSLLEEPGFSQLPPQPWLEQSYNPHLLPHSPWGSHHIHDTFLSWGPRSRGRIQMWFPECEWALMPSGCLNPSPVLCPGACWAVQVGTNLCWPVGTVARLGFAWSLGLSVPCPPLGYSALHSLWALGF